MALLETHRRLYIVGIKGVGMTALAQLLKARGHEVTGSDTNETFFTDAVLASHGIPVHQGFSPENVPSEIDAVIYSTAYTLDHPELALAARRSIPLFTYPQILGKLFLASEGVAVCGSHGKTTTTAMLGSILLQGGADPTVIVGSAIPDFHGNALVGRSKLLVVETDEYQNKFTHYQPRHIVLTNIEYDHPDFFSTPESYLQAFEHFLARLPADALLVTNDDDPQSVALVERLGRTCIRFGTTARSDLRLLETTWLGDHQDVKVQVGEKVQNFFLRLPGRHNAMNACAALAFAGAYGIPFAASAKALVGFHGVKRRFELLREFQGIPVIDDYAHHPSEIVAAIATARECYPGRRLVTVFQPHTYSRTKTLLKEFAASLAGDEVVLLEIYGSAREKERSVSSGDLARLLPSTTPVLVCATLLDAAESLKKRLMPNDVLLLLGAGDTWRLAGMLDTSGNLA